MPASGLRTVRVVRGARADSTPAISSGGMPNSASRWRAAPMRSWSPLFQERQKFDLRTRPLGNEQIHDRRTPGNHITRCPGIHPRDEAIATRLDDGDVALIEFDRADGIEGVGKGAPLYACEADAEVLTDVLGSIVMPFRRGIPAFIGIPGHQLHVHVGRFLPGLSKCCSGLIGSYQ